MTKARSFTASGHTQILLIFPHRVKINKNTNKMGGPAPDSVNQANKDAGEKVTVANLDVWLHELTKKVAILEYLKETGNGNYPRGDYQGKLFHWGIRDGEVRRIFDKQPG